MLKDLCANKEKLEELANTPLSENCSAVILKKLPRNWEILVDFTITMNFSKLELSKVLADLGASNNLIPRSGSIHRLGFTNLESTPHDSELANVTWSTGMDCKDVLVPPFLRTARALIDVYDEKLILRDGNESLTLNMQSEKSKLNGIQKVESINMIDIFNVPNYIGFKDLFAQMYSGSPTIQSNDSFPSSSPVKTSDNIEKFTDELAPLDSLPSGNDDSTLKKDFQEETFQITSNSLFEFDESFKSSNVNPLFEENDKDVEIKFSSSITLTSPQGNVSIPPGIDLTIPSIFEVSSSNPTSPTLTGEKDLKKDLPISFDSTTTSILPHPLLDSDSPFTAELSASVTLNSLGNEDKVFKPGILVYHAIHDKNLVTLEKNLKENISSGTLLAFKKPSFLLPPAEPPNECLKNAVLNFYQSKKTFPLNVEDVNSFAFIIWTFLPFFTYTKASPVIFSFRSENFVFDPGILTIQWQFQ
ncbi:hypothetical protein Tco_0966673 [Tanacetum coccineum]